MRKIKISLLNNDESRVNRFNSIFFFSRDHNSWAQCQIDFFFFVFKLLFSPVEKRAHLEKQK